MLGLVKKITVNIEILDNLEYLTHTVNHLTKYSQSKIQRGILMYYRAGYRIMYAHEFAEKYRKISNYKPISDFVLMISVNSNVAGNDRNIIRQNGGTFLIFSVDITSIRHMNEFHPNPGPGFNPNLLTYTNLNHTINTRLVEIHAHAEQETQFSTLPKNYVYTVEKLLDSAFTALLEVSSTVNMPKIHADPEAQRALLNLCQKFFLFLDIYNTKSESTRQHLINMLNADSAQEAQNSFSFMVDGVPFEDANMYKYYSQMYGHEEGVQQRKKEVRAIYLYSIKDLKQTALEATEQEIQDYPDLMMTPEQQGKLLHFIADWCRDGTKITGAQAMQFVQQDIDRLAPVIKSLNFKLD